MRKLIVSEFVTLDGVMEAPGGEEGHPHSGWVFDFHGPDQEKYKLDETLSAEALLLGRVTYEGFSEAWPGRGGEFADKMNSMPKFVVSSTLKDPEWENTTVLDGDVVEEVTKLKEGDGGPILVAGSCTLVHALIENGLDRRAAGDGLPRRDRGRQDGYSRRPRRRRTLELADTETFDTGVVVHAYRPRVS